jgi:RND family efflux transporter MFP subunit
MKSKNIKNTISMYKYAGILLVAVGLAACGGKGNDKKAQLEDLRKEKAALDEKIAKLEKEVGPDAGDSASKPKTIVAVKEAKAVSFKHYLEVQGKVESDENVLVTPRIPGVLITDVLVKRGDRVSKGQVLARQDAGGLPQQLQALKVQAANADAMYQKAKRLWDQKIGTEVNYLNAKAQKEALESQVSGMEQQLGMYTVRAPFGGTVDDVTIHAGEAGNPMAGVRIVNYAKTKVVAQVSEAYAGKINQGDEVLVSFPDINKEIKTTVRVAGKAIDPVSRTFVVELGVSGADIQSLQPNMVAVIKINDYSNKSVITLPVNAIQKDEAGATYVYITEQQGKSLITKKRSVRTGQTSGPDIEVLSGLNGGEKVIVEGYQNVVEGQEVSL